LPGGCNCDSGASDGRGGRRSDFRWQAEHARKTAGKIEVTLRPQRAFGERLVERLLAVDYAQERQRHGYAKQRLRLRRIAAADRQLSATQIGQEAVSGDVEADRSLDLL